MTMPRTILVRQVQGNYPILIVTDLKSIAFIYSLRMITFPLKDDFLKMKIKSCQVLFIFALTQRKGAEGFGNSPE